MQLALDSPNEANAPLRLRTTPKKGDSPYTMPFAAKARAKPTTRRMKRLLKACDVTVEQFTDWMGWDLKRVLAANPTWTERQWVDLVLENRRA